MYLKEQGNNRTTIEKNQKKRFFPKKKNKKKKKEFVPIYHLRGYAKIVLSNQNLLIIFKRRFRFRRDPTWSGNEEPKSLSDADGPKSL